MDIKDLIEAELIKQWSLGTTYPEATDEVRKITKLRVERILCIVRKRY